MLRCFNKFNACLLQFRVNTQDAALVIEGMEQTCQFMHIMCNAVYGTFLRCRSNQLRIFAQLFDKLGFSRVGQQSIISVGRFFNACFLQLAEDAANTRMCILDIVNRVLVGFFGCQRQVKVKLAVDAKNLAASVPTSSISSFSVTLWPVRLDILTSSPLRYRLTICKIKTSSWSGL